MSLEHAETQQRLRLDNAKRRRPARDSADGRKHVQQRLAPAVATGFGSVDIVECISAFCNWQVRARLNQLNHLCYGVTRARCAADHSKLLAVDAVQFVRSQDIQYFVDELSRSTYASLESVLANYRPYAKDAVVPLRMAYLTCFCLMELPDIIRGNKILRYLEIISVQKTYFYIAYKGRVVAMVTPSDFVCTTKPFANIIVDALSTAIIRGSRHPDWSSAHFKAIVQWRAATRRFREHSVQ